MDCTIIYEGGEMKSRVLQYILLLIVVVLISIGTLLLTTRQFNTESACEERLITVLSPAISRGMVAREPLAPRKGSLEGKTIYLVDLQWGGPDAAYSVYKEMEKWFAKNKPSIKVVIRRSKGGWMGDDAELRKEIADNKAAGVVIGIGG